MDAGSPALPAVYVWRPVWTNPLRKVPVAIMTAPAPRRRLSCISTPPILSLLITRSTTIPCRRCRFDVSSSARRISLLYRDRSACARGDCTAGPLDRFSNLNWIPVRSMTRPMRPPSASISRTKCPLAIPPIAGLQDICPIRSRFKVTSAVCAPSRAAADAASQPACPPPITMTSNTSSKSIVTFRCRNLKRFSRGYLPESSHQ